MLVLSILHSIFLKEQEIEKLKQNVNVEVVGVSLPIWYTNNKTSEPAEEVFCKYTIKNQKNKEQNIKFKNNGYVIYLPQIPEGAEYKDLTTEQLKSMSLAQIKEWEKNNNHYPSILDLENDAITRKNCLEIKHIFKVNNKNNRKLITHKVIMMPEKILLNSIS